jgi:IclR family KDG regulon transcriptional repressor
MRGGGEAPLKEISQQVGLSKSTTHGLLATLESRGLVGHSPSGAYTLGLRLIELGNAAVERLDLRSQASDVLRDLVKVFDETVHLVTLDGSDVVYIDKVEGTQSMRIVSRVGGRLPAACTGVGKAILANLDAVRLERILDAAELPPFTRNTITDKAKLLEHLMDVRRRGHAIDDEEISEGLRCVAAPIFDHTGSCIGALSISGPSVRIGPARVEDMIPVVCQAAATVSTRLGFKLEMRIRA